MASLEIPQVSLPAPDVMGSINIGSRKNSIIHSDEPSLIIQSLSADVESLLRIGLWPQP